MKIGFLITARLKSSRLPLKIIKNLNGKTVIDRVIDRAKQVKGISEIVLCTSTNPQDKLLIDIAKSNDIYYFNGDEDDVLLRLKDAAILYNFDYILSITADNPLFSTYYANIVADNLARNNNDFIKITDLPIGLSTYGLRTKAMEVVCRIKNIIDTEIWGTLFDRPDIFKVDVIKASEKYAHAGLRLTLDYQEDYDLINNIYTNVPFEGTVDVDVALDYLKNNPELIKINKDCCQYSMNEDIQSKVNNYFKNHRDDILAIKDEIYDNKR